MILRFPRLLLQTKVLQQTTTLHNELNLSVMLNISVGLVPVARLALAQLAAAADLLVQRDHHHDEAGQAYEHPGEVERQIVRTCYVEHPPWNKMFGIFISEFLFSTRPKYMESQVSEVFLNVM